VTRERDRYRRASWGEQLREGFLGFWRNRTARLVAAILLGGLLVLRLITPDVVRLSELAPGDCIYLRTPESSDPLGPPRLPATPADLQQYDTVERAACDLSHSHEVSAVLDLGAAATAYPGRNALVTDHAARCDAAFESYVGRALDGSRYATALAPPNSDTWRDGVRKGLCLVFSADGSLMDHRAGGSRE
jgi:hypothetical protein